MTTTSSKEGLLSLKRKKQRNFIHLGFTLLTDKSFLVLFFKKELLPSC